MNFSAGSIVLLSLLKIVQSSKEVAAEKLVRKKRWPEYTPYQTGLGFGAALSVPLDNGRGDIFLSYCITISPAYPNFDQSFKLDPPPFTTFYYQEGRKNDGDKKAGEITQSSENHQRVDKDESKKKKSKHQYRNVGLTRKRFYRIFSDHLFENGFNAKHCLLKAICETAQYQFGETNGLLGDLVHILFTPTSSKSEKLPAKYYEAEESGKSNLCDFKYGKLCPISIFDLITLIR